ncbi:transglycosylase [Mycobacterium intracellulare]|uniref:Transglycosylase n=1 Tax=Mycobacterium intracellulare TaxID=1767 RepID=A0AAE4U8G8_MYCIT|nr:transglycosylase [Mycobacterium intracellulare]MCA2318108.1 transglycosylase [Mycobacterium intracellulare]MCA2340394.1 transglycosylase [Mycobacterium intracellulare]MDV6974714.1 transglycosylase [Mycobacterium intracellulare]MDV6981163.1 transglycosylase [Mycobacterium intracellulare]MDV7011561.1 transglycosylase [Mycobacterium intracellulare]
MQAVAALVRAHNLFAGTPISPHIGDVAEQTHPMARHAAALPKTASARSGASIKLLNHSSHADRTVGDIIAAARADHERARAATRAVLEAAESDVTPAADTPMGRREAMARTATRLRTQHRHVTKARRRAKLLAHRLRRLHYPRRRSMHRNHASGRQAVLAAIRKALDIKGIHDPAARARWERGMDLVARRESNYNANAINNWDSNAARGTPSKGAFQFIAPTFAAYHQPGTSRDIHNLVAQACAFINYAMGRYGVAVDASNLADRIQQADPRRSPKGY